MNFYANLNTNKHLIDMQITQFLTVTNSYTASPYDITLQQKIGWLQITIEKALVHKGVDGRGTVRAIMGGFVCEMTFQTKD